MSIFDVFNQNSETETDIELEKYYKKKGSLKEHYREIGRMAAKCGLAEILILGLGDEPPMLTQAQANKLRKKRLTTESYMENIYHREFIDFLVRHLDFIEFKRGEK